MDFLYSCVERNGEVRQQIAYDLFFSKAKLKLAIQDIP